ncbi:MULTISPECIES: toxin-antitoxin system, toxin component [Streptomyces]|uniref:Toxin-antitoxin system, toxin component n=1 Tax=Streptomyces venezuelae TaxID=54571 RepID=A0A5P2B024_STRVZ|nr:toxin-antitoxin system, toxin component [Streptomyces venezuelae]QES21719.1 toxin-antitoxin system, toxin component [Streptomyces venezuelae]
MKRHRDDLFAGTARPAGQEPHELLRAICAYVTESGGREVRLMLEPFPPDTVSGLWLDLGDHEVIAVEKNTLPFHQMVILGHELWHRKEGRCGKSGSPAGGAAAARMLGDGWTLAEACAHVAARTDHSVAEERRAEEFGRLLAAKFRPFLIGARGGTSQGDAAGRIWASLAG